MGKKKVNKKQIFAKNVVPVLALIISFIIHFSFFSITLFFAIRDFQNLSSNEEENTEIAEENEETPTEDVTTEEENLIDVEKYFYLVRTDDEGNEEDIFEFGAYPDHFMYGDLTVYNDYLYAATQNGLQLYDMKNDTVRTLIPSDEIGYGPGFSIIDDVMYIWDVTYLQPSNFYSLDATNPGELTTLPVPDIDISINSISKRGDRIMVYLRDGDVCEGWGGIYEFDPDSLEYHELLYWVSGCSEGKDLLGVTDNYIYYSNYSFEWDDVSHYTYTPIYKDVRRIHIDSGKDELYLDGNSPLIKDASSIYVIKESQYLVVAKNNALSFVSLVGQNIIKSFSSDDLEEGFIFTSIRYDDKEGYIYTSALNEDVNESKLYRINMKSWSIEESVDGINEYIPEGKLILFNQRLEELGIDDEYQVITRSS